MACQSDKVFQIFKPRQATIEHDLFGDIAQVLLSFPRVPRYVQSFHLHLAGSRLDEIEEEIDRCGFARAVRTEQAKYLPRTNLQVQARQSRMGSVQFLQFDGFQHDFHLVS
ncbi:MAG: hypothetical protein R3C12_22020 [Planctomycetaceae bacterium]